jgi:hypothetical protein
MPGVDDILGTVNIPKVTPQTLTASYSSPDWQTVRESVSTANLTAQLVGLRPELPAVNLQREALPEPLFPPPAER